MKQTFRKEYIILTILVILGVAFYWSQTKPETKPEVININNIATTTTDILSYEIDFVQSFVDESHINKTNKIFLRNNNSVVFATEVDQDFGGFYVDKVGDWLDNANEIKMKAVKDITGNGIPELILSGYSGESHCCSHNYIIELSDPISILLDIDTGDYGIEFKDLNNDKIMEIETYDSVFSYWNTSFGASPAPYVVMSLQNDKYKADPKLMRKSPPTDTDIKKMADAVTSWSASAGPEVAWKYVIDLIYSGNINSARKYVDLAWHNSDYGDFKTKDNFWNELKMQIAKSVYYKDLSGYFGI